MNAEFRSDYVYTIQGNVIAIVDLNLGNRSVYHDIENIFDDLRRELKSGLSGYAIIYRDQIGNWDGILLTEQGQVDFYALKETTQEKAVKRLLHLLP